MRDEFIELLVAQLESELPLDPKGSIQEFLDFVDQKKFRPAFRVLYELKDSGKVHFSERLLKLLEEFWWEYAN